MLSVYRWLSDENSRALCASATVSFKARGEEASCYVANVLTFKRKLPCVISISVLFLPDFAENKGTGSKRKTSNLCLRHSFSCVCVMQVSLLLICLYYRECPCRRGVHCLEFSSKNCLWWKTSRLQKTLPYHEAFLFVVASRWILLSVISRIPLKLIRYLELSFVSSLFLVGPWCDLWRHRFHHD